MTAATHKLYLPDPEAREAAQAAVVSEVAELTAELDLKLKEGRLLGAAVPDVFKFEVTTGAVRLEVPAGTSVVELHDVLVNAARDLWKENRIVEPESATQESA